DLRNSKAREATRIEVRAAANAAADSQCSATPACSRSLCFERAISLAWRNTDGPHNAASRRNAKMGAEEWVSG
ncbi:MAG: hypothetical protein ACRD6I_09285, partial [Candidatus Acidiferrales bacterium]